jgi:hypothetical protein
VAHDLMLAPLFKCFLYVFKIDEFNKMKCDSFNGTTQQCFCLVFKNYNMINGCNFEDGQWGIYNASAKLLKIGG